MLPGNYRDSTDVTLWSLLRGLEWDAKEVLESRKRGRKENVSKYYCTPYTAV